MEVDVVLLLFFFVFAGIAVINSFSSRCSLINLSMQRLKSLFHKSGDCCINHIVQLNHSESLAYDAYDA
jgi:hypothetical protein